MDKIVKIPTGISTVYWNEVTDDKYETAKICIGNDQKKTVSWFDELFRGGIGIFEDKTTTMLIKGPPGSGKSSLALELCYRLGKIHQYKSLYISIESDKEQILRNIKDSYGWEKDTLNEHFIAVLNDKGDYQDTHLGIWNPKKLKSWVNISEIVDSAFKTIAEWYKVKLSRGLIQSVKTIIINRGFKNRFKPKVLVIDSLNIVPVDEQTKAFQHFLRITQKKKETRLMIFILDGSLSSDNNPFWDFFCDIIIELNYENTHDYYTRTFEIIKARYQEHVWGKHQLKIYPKEQERIEQDDLKMLRAHPFRNEGGIYIFPSIHFYLSKYKRISAKGRPTYDETFPQSLNKILERASSKSNGTSEAGFPRGRCTAFIGCRGGHKSHLAYLHIIHRLILGLDSNKEATLVISLRDDEKMTENTMQNILTNEFPSVTKTIQDFIRNCNLEILYYPPGYISAEEFLHRIFISIHKLKKSKHNDPDKHVTVMFNSLDQLNARFPLCAKQEIFIPSIIQLLTGEEITSIFIAVDEKGQPTGQYGLLPMADLIISFHKYRMDMKTYLSIFGQLPKYDFHDYTKDEDEQLKIFREEVILAVDRYAGGRKAGTKGIIELGNEFKININGADSREVINFVALSQRFNFKDTERIE
jgi:KaiC/GvpD/RAD55 family RecA-like ATPase